MPILEDELLRTVPVEWHDAREHIHAHTLDHRLHARGIASQHIAPCDGRGDTVRAESLLHRGEREARHEVDVVGGAYVAVRAHRQPPDEQAVVRIQDGGDAARDARQVPLGRGPHLGMASRSDMTAALSSLASRSRSRIAAISTGSGL